MSTDTEAASHIHRLCLQSHTPDPDALQKTVLNIMAEAGHGHLLPPELEEYTSDEGSMVEDINTPLRMSPLRRIIIETAQKMQPESPGLTANELLNPSGATRGTPRQDVVVPPTRQASAPALQLSG